MNSTVGSELDAGTPGVLSTATLTQTSINPSSTPNLSGKLSGVDASAGVLSALQAVLQTAVGPQGWPRVADALSQSLTSNAPTATELALGRARQALAEALSSVGNPQVPSDLLSLAALGEAARNLGQAVVSLPSSILSNPRVEFCQGLVDGVNDALLKEVADQVTMLTSLIETLVDYYEFVYDWNLYGTILNYWLSPADQRGDILSQIAREIQQAHPQVWTMLTYGVKVADALRALAQPGGTGDTFDPVIKALSDWLTFLPQTMARALRPTIERLVAAKGNAHEQGRIIGQTVTPVIIQVAMAALGVADLVALTAEFMAVRLAEGAAITLEVADQVTADAVAYVRDAESAVAPREELAAAATLVEKQAPGITASAAATSTSTIGQLVHEYGEFDIRISPYNSMNKQTGAWHKAVQAYTGLTTKDVEYAVSLRLDAQHIIGAKYFRQFLDQFKKVFTDWKVCDSLGNPVLDRAANPLTVSWQSEVDMDALALHSEEHIRSGDRMSENLKLFGFEGIEPLDPRMDKFFEKLQQGKPFQNVREVIEAHKRFYQEEHTSGIWPRVSKWFERAEQALEKAGYPPPGSP